MCTMLDALDNRSNDVILLAVKIVVNFLWNYKSLNKFYTSDVLNYQTHLYNRLAIEPVLDT